MYYVNRRHPKEDNVQKSSTSAARILLVIEKCGLKTLLIDFQKAVSEMTQCRII